MLIIIIMYQRKHLFVNCLHYNQLLHIYDTSMTTRQDAFNMMEWITFSIEWLKRIYGDDIKFYLSITIARSAVENGRNVQTPHVRLLSFLLLWDLERTMIMDIANSSSSSFVFPHQLNLFFLDILSLVSKQKSCGSPFSPANQQLRFFPFSKAACLSLFSCYRYSVTFCMRYIV